MINNNKIAVVIPCFRVSEQIVKVIERIPEYVDMVYVVDDYCDHNSGRMVEKNCSDSRIHIIYHEYNQGVGGAVITGYFQAVKDKMDIVVKIDGDNQMDSFSNT